MLKYLSVCVLILIQILHIGCSSQSEGERLARQYCVSCHVFPEPDLLDKNTWQQSILPEMAFRMGLDNEKLFNVPYIDLDKVRTAIPDNPLVTPEDYKLIEEYFIKNAPDSLGVSQKPVTNTISQFTVIGKSFPFYPKAYVTALTFDSIGNKLYMGDRLSVIYKFDPQFNLEEYISVKSPPSRIYVENDSSIVVSLIGIMDPNDQAKGSLIQANASFTHASMLVDSLQRPTHFEIADLDGDKYQDLVVCAFGNYTGQLLAFQNTGETYVKHVLSYTSGARKVVMKDVNDDNLPDILVLTTQGNEKLSLFINKGDFKFQEQVLLQFPPVYGSSYFELADFNDDGLFDILYTNGDNADYSTILKPYHGVKIFVNMGDLKFRELWSYPMHGASQAMARDFDNDGDLDIAAISFFPDFNNFPEESFIYFENQGDNTFMGNTTPMARKGRWMVMEVGDLDQDGDKDIILGAHNVQMEHTLKKIDSNPDAVLLFENNER